MMKKPTTGILRKTGGVVAAGLVAATVAAAPALSADGDQKQTLATPLLNQPTPDPAIAKGLEVFQQSGSVMGRLDRVIDRNGRRFAVLMPVQGVAGGQRTIPYESLDVIDGIITYRPE